MKVSEIFGRGLLEHGGRDDWRHHRRHHRRHNRWRRRWHNGWNRW